MRVGQVVSYVFAALSFVAAVPMYLHIVQRYRLEHASPFAPRVRVPSSEGPRLVLPDAPMVRPEADGPRLVLPDAPVVRSEADSRQFYYYEHGHVPAGYRCSGAGGYVYRTRVVSGSTVLELMEYNGRKVRCAGNDESWYQ